MGGRVMSGGKTSDGNMLTGRSEDGNRLMD